MPFAKKALFYCLLTILTLAAVEGMARLAYYLAFDQWYAEWWGGRPQSTAQFSTPQYSADPGRIRYPFYGYTPHSPYADMYLPPQQQSPMDDTVVIGLLGGSVAWEVRSPFRRAVHRYFSANALPRPPVVVPLSVPGMQQPGQTITIANLLALGGHLDIIVNLDGRNEINLGEISFTRQSRSPFFPWAWFSGLTAAESRLVGRIGALRAQVAQRQGAARSSPFRYTALYGLLHRWQLQRTTTAIIQLNHELLRTRTAYTLEKHGPIRHHRDHKAIFRETAAGWYRASLLLSELAQLAGAEYYHFQQPNQYVPGAKPLTAAELACCYAAGSLKETVYRETYPLLVPLGQRLQQQGVNYFDLNEIFADNHETLYRDECCHLNDRGNELLAAALVERLAPALHNAATAAPPVSPLTPAARPWPEQLRTEPLLLDADFQVYRRADHWLRYVKDNCSPQDAETWFFLHIIPADPADLPPDRRQYGFDNRDFQFEGAGIRLNNQCIAQQLLPDYPIAAFRTGQYSQDGAQLWAGEYRFPE